MSAYPNSPIVVSCAKSSRSRSEVNVTHMHRRVRGLTKHDDISDRLARLNLESEHRCLTARGPLPPELCVEQKDREAEGCYMRLSQYTTN